MRAKQRSCAVSSLSTHRAVQREISPPISPAKACPRLGPPVIRTRLVVPPGIISAALAVAMVAGLSATNCISAKYIGMFAQQFSIRKRRRSRSAAIRKNATSSSKTPSCGSFPKRSGIERRRFAVSALFTCSGRPASRGADPWSRATTSIRLQESFGAAFAMAICESLNPPGMADHAPPAPTRISEAPASTPAVFDMDVLLKDVAEKMEVRLLSPKAIEEAMRAWKEERKSDQRKNSERSNLERRRHVLNTESERLSYAIANSRRKPDELVKRIDECDAERETVEERLRLLGNGGENVIPFDHPRFGDRYRLEAKRLVTALKTNPKAIETRVAFRNLVDCIIVHPVRKRMPYEYTPYKNAAALFSMQLFPENCPKTGKISTFVCYDNVQSEKSVSS